MVLKIFLVNFFIPTTQFGIGASSDGSNPGSNPSEPTPPGPPVNDLGVEL